MAGRWDWVADGVAITTSRREATNSTLVLDGNRALLVDPAWDPDELGWIAADLAARGLVVAAGFATHAHHDHLLWHPGLGGAPRLASVGTAALAAARRDELASALGPGWPADLAALVGRVHGTARDRLPWAGRAVELRVHDAHCAGHTALWVPDGGVLLAGDMLSDRELPLLETSTADQYLAGLRALEPFARRAAALVPGHGSPAVGAAAATARWDADTHYLEELAAGRDPVDPRVAHPGMGDAHRANLLAVASSR